MRQTRLFHASIFALIGALFTACGSSSPPPGRRAAVPVEAIPAILDAFRSYDVVALADGYPGNDQGHAFRVALVREPRFAETVTDIVVESSNARRQNTANGVARGEQQSGAVSDAPTSNDFLQAVRDVNSSLPASRHIRVWFGDQPGQTAALIQREIVSQGRRALVIYSHLHLVRSDPFDSSEPEHGRSIVTRLERAAAMRVFSVWTHTFGGDLKTVQSNVDSWPTPSLVMLSGTQLGGTQFLFYFPFEVFIDGKRSRALFGKRMDEQFNALLYLGPPPVSQVSSR